jgi:betaine-aldehyde dehydrogenase
MARPILVGGTWRPGRGPLVPSIYPADQSEVDVVATAALDDVADAVDAAERAFRESGWSSALPHERARVLGRVADIIDSRSEELAQLQRLDNGKPISETRALVASAAGTFRFVAAALETMGEELAPPRGNYLSIDHYEPIGVVAAITPWNSPIASEAQKLAPALAAGNAVILKPAEATPLVALELGSILQTAGVPDGLVSVLPGAGEVVGDALVRHPAVGKVSFTGGTATGRHIGRIAADKVMPVTLELGGKSPTIVRADARFDQALAGVAFGIFGSAGQACVAGSRLLVAEAIADRFVPALVDLAERLPLGDPADPETRIGPLISHDHRDRVARYVELARAEGATVLTGGSPPSNPSLARGPYYLPTVIDGLDPRSAVCQEEIFGPVLTVHRFGVEDELLHLANDVDFGLAAGVWTTDLRGAWQLARQLRVGTVWCNTYKQLSIATPFGGVGHSGLGREKGRLGIREYMRQQSIYLGLDDAPLPWAAPFL